MIILIIGYSTGLAVLPYFEFQHADFLIPIVLLACIVLLGTDIIKTRYLLENERLIIARPFLRDKTYYYKNITRLEEVNKAPISYLKLFTSSQKRPLILAIANIEEFTYSFLSLTKETKRPVFDIDNKGFDLQLKNV